MLALQALCCFDAAGDGFAERLPVLLRDPEVLSDLKIDDPPPADVLAFARRLADGAWAHHPRYDALLAETVAHWSLQRMTPVDRNVLRLGLFELLELRDAPPQVVFNEAIELARLFGDRQSPAFVNGVLDAVWKRSTRPEVDPLPRADAPAEPCADREE